jgi:hypothetical protein
MNNGVGIADDSGNWAAVFGGTMVSNFRFSSGRGSDARISMRFTHVASRRQDKLGYAHLDWQRAATRAGDSSVTSSVLAVG